MKKKISETQRKYIAEYLDCMNICAVAEKFGVAASTVSRTIQRALNNSGADAGIPLPLRKRSELVNAMTYGGERREKEVK